MIGIGPAIPSPKPCARNTKLYIRTANYVQMEMEVRAAEAASQRTAREEAEVCPQHSKS